MAKKLIIGITGLVLLVAAAVFAAEKAKEKKEADKPDKLTVPSEVEGAKACQMEKHGEGLLDQLIKAYKADDKKAMGEIIAKMEQRREKMQKFAQFNKWHQQAHRGDGHGFAPQAGRGCGGCCGGMTYGPPPQWRHQPGEFERMRGRGQEPRHFDHSGVRPKCNTPDGNDPSPDSDW